MDVSAGPDQTHDGNHDRDLAEDDNGSDSKESNGWLCFNLKRPGLIWAVLAGLSQSVQVLLLAENAHNMNPLQTLFLRSCFILVFVFFISWDESENYDSQDLALNILFGILDVVGMSSFLIATGFLPVSDATAIVYNQPIPAIIFACIFLGETFDRIDGVLVVVNAIGLVLVCKTSIANHAVSDKVSSVIGVFVAFFALLCVVSLKLTARKLAHKGRQDPSLITLTLGCTGLIMSTAYLAITNSWDMPRTQQDVLLSIVLGLVAIFHFYCFSKAVQTENIIFISTAFTFPIPVTYCFDVIMNRTILSIITIIGVGLTMGSTLVLYLKTIYAE
ncbi:pseudopaline exporter CntI-like [Apostichopus japonicus]|uniref:pseudopaline exporter CntI-like n=1 Tax=Stichopus japonicus TaxID=307972 RepID=UPI003AB8427C